MTTREWSPAVACFDIFMHFLWSVLVFGTCAYEVFSQGQSGWWFALAALIAVYL